MRRSPRLRDTPLAAFVELRARLAWRRGRGRGGVAELVARAVAFAVVLPAGLLFAALVGAATWRAARQVRGIEIEIGVTAIFFGIWQAWTATALVLQEREAVDLRRYLVYPLRPARVYAYGLAASLLGDPFSTFWLLMLTGAFVGAAAGRFGPWLLPLGAVLALFAAATASYAVLLEELAARLLRRRRLRPILAAAAYLGLAAGLAAAATVASADRLATLRRAWAALRLLRWGAWPAALAASAARHLFRREPAAAFAPALALALGGLLAGWAAFRLALGEARGAGSTAGAARGGRRGALGWRTGGLPRALGPLLEIAGKQLLRHPLPALSLVLLPGLAAVVAWRLTPLLPADAGEVIRALPLLGFALSTHLATEPFWLNAFGWERGGARLLFLAPVDPRDALLAKNLAAYALSAALYLACGIATVAVGGPAPAWALAAAVALHAGLAPYLHGLGNFVSILNPRHAPLTLQRSGSLPALSALAGMTIVSTVAGLFALPVLLAVRLDEAWVLPAAWAVLAAGGAALYRALLPRAARLLATSREALVASVSGDGD